MADIGPIKKLFALIGPYLLSLGSTAIMSYSDSIQSNLRLTCPSKIHFNIIISSV